jgi:predicted transcriptional regulator
MTTTTTEEIDGEVMDDEPGSELEVYDAEVVEPLNKTQAKALDKKIRSQSNKVTKDLNSAQDNFDALIELLAEAAEGDIHKALGLKSWAVYVKDAVNIEVQDRGERKSLVNLMSDKGLSQRAIAGVLNVSQKTVDRDLDDAEPDTDDAKVTGLDGKQYNKSKVIDAEVDPEVEEPPAKPASFSEDFRTEVYQLQNDLAMFKELVLEDERFPKARTRLAKSKVLEEFRSALEGFDEIYNTIVGGESEAEE